MIPNAIIIVFTFYVQHHKGKLRSINWEARNLFTISTNQNAMNWLVLMRPMSILPQGELWILLELAKKSRKLFFRVTAAILHLGNLEFTKGKDADSSVLKDDKAKFHLKMSAELHRCDATGLEDALCERVMVGIIYIE